MRRLWWLDFGKILELIALLKLLDSNFLERLILFLLKNSNISNMYIEKSDLKGY